MQQGMKHSSWAISPVNGIHYLAFPICHSLKRKPKQVEKKKTIAGEFLQSCVLSFPISCLLCSLLKEALPLLPQHVEGAACS